MGDEGPDVVSTVEHDPNNCPFVGCIQPECIAARLSAQKDMRASRLEIAPMDIKQTKRKILEKIAKHESGDLAEEWAKTYLLLCEAQRMELKLEDGLPLTAPTTINSGGKSFTEEIARYQKLVDDFSKSSVSFGSPTDILHFLEAFEPNFVEDSPARAIVRAMQAMLRNFYGMATNARLQSTLNSTCSAINDRHIGTI